MLVVYWICNPDKFDVREEIFIMIISTLAKLGGFGHICLDMVHHYFEL